MFQKETKIKYFIVRKLYTLDIHILICIYISLDIKNKHAILCITNHFTARIDPFVTKTANIF